MSTDDSNCRVGGTTLAMRTSLPRRPGNTAMSRDLADALHEIVRLFEGRALSYAAMGVLPQLNEALAKYDAEVCSVR